MNRRGTKNGVWTKSSKAVPAQNKGGIVAGGLRFAAPTPPKSETVKAKQKSKNDPRLVAAARELRDRWLEQVNATPLLSHGKYEVSRAIEANQSASKPTIVSIIPALPAPIAA